VRLAAADRVDVLVVAGAARLRKGSRGGDGEGEHGEQGGNSAAGGHGGGF
jgi:hypothetical protein